MPTNLHIVKWEQTEKLQEKITTNAGYIYFTGGIYEK